MSAQNIEIVGLNDLLSDFKKAGGDAKPLVMGALRNSTSHGQRNIRTRAPHAFGTLQRSVLTDIHYPVGEIEVQAKHGPDVEYGTKPHTPPTTAIQRWAKKKGIPGSAVWPIIKTIEKRGTKAQPFFKPGWEASQGYIKEQFDKVADRLLRIMARGN